MRDKLIELLKKKYDHYCDQCGVNKDTHYLENLADYLISHGVTFADVPDNNVGDKWIPVSERLPEKTGYYFVHHKGGFVSERYFYEEAPEMFVPYGNEPVTHWMLLPEPPKEDE